MHHGKDYVTKNELVVSINHGKIVKYDYEPWYERLYNHHEHYYYINMTLNVMYIDL